MFAAISALLDLSLLLPITVSKGGGGEGEGGEGSENSYSNLPGCQDSPSSSKELKLIKPQLFGNHDNHLT